MRNKLKKRGWYDGWFYATFIDGDSFGLREILFREIEPGQSVLDVGCGTGGLALKLAEKCQYVAGVDISAKQIKVAQKRKQKSGLQNVEFFHTNGDELTEIFQQKFDTAVFSFVLHEMNPQERMDVLNSVKKISSKLIILDYPAPLVKNIWGIFIRLIEFIAGKEHFRNYKHFQKNNGLKPLLEKSGFSILNEKLNRKKIITIVSAHINSF